jgi:outer membrane protein assembly factor BamB
VAAPGKVGYASPMRFRHHLLVMLLAAGTAARAADPCPDGRFLVEGARVLAEDGESVVEAVVLERGLVSLNSGCAPVEAKVQGKRKRTRVNARFDSCDGAKAKLKAAIDAETCNTMRGKLIVKGAKPKVRRFTAARAPYAYDVPVDPRSPWPKFRRTAAQDGRSPVRPTTTGGHLWVFPTGKGIFSTPVIGGDGTVYIGSADRTFYAIEADGALRWELLTGEIIDSSALLDDQGRLYIPSGDGNLYARDAASGAPVWTFAADPPSVSGAFINWFEGNVAIGGDGTLYVPNDNFFTYALDRDTTDVRWRFETADQTWSLPAVDPVSNRLFVGNNNLLALLGANTFALDATDGTTIWDASSDGSIAASPALAGGAMIVGGFDGFVRSYDQATGELRWEVGARDHIYASPAVLPDGTIVQPAADGTVYALDPGTGALRWQFDAREALRSSPAVDGDGNVYLGSGEGRLFVLNPDGTLRWSIRLIDDPRDDLNASPALGADSIVIAGESGEIFSLPYDYCLRPEAASDGRCRLGPGEDLPADGPHLFYTTAFGRQLDVPPATIEANQPLTFSLYVRAAGDTQLALIDSPTVNVVVTPSVPIRTEVSGDRRFITVVPEGRFAGESGGTIDVSITGDYLVNLERTGLQFSGGEKGGSFAGAFQFAVAPAAAGGTLPLPVPAAPGDPSGVWELSRIAQPLPTILPSYNQIGFDSLHYLIGLVGTTSDGHPLAWVVGGKLAEGVNETVVDPATRVLFPLELTYDGGLLTLLNTSGFAIEFNAIRLPFTFFRIATRLGLDGAALSSAAMNVSVLCGDITFYGQFLRQLGFCNPQTDLLATVGAAELRPHAGGVQTAPTGVGTVSFSAGTDGVTALFSPTTALRADTQSVSLLLVDPVTNRPIPLDYGFATSRTSTSGGALESVRASFAPGSVTGDLRAYLMVDAYPAAQSAVMTVP